MKKLLNYLVFLVFLVVVSPFKVMPLGMVRALGRGAGLLWFMLDARHRRIVLSNLEIALGKEKSPGELKALRLEVFKNIGTTLMESLFWPRLNHSNIERYLKIEGMEHLDHAHKGSSSAIIAIYHQAAFVWFSWTSHYTKRPILVILQKIPNPYVNDYYLQKVKDSGLISVPPRGAVDEIIKRKGEDMDFAFFADQRGHRVKGIYAPFFGRMASNNPGIAVLARKHGIPIVPSEVYRTEYGLYGRFMPALKIPHTDDMEADIKETMRLMNEHYEKVIRVHPESYFWMHERWRWSSPDDIDYTAPEAKMLKKNG